MFVNETSLKKLMNGEELTEMERTTIERSFEALRSNREAKQRAREQLERDVLDCLKKKKMWGASLPEIRIYLQDLNPVRYHFITEAKIRNVITKLDLDNCVDNYTISQKLKSFSTELGTVKQTYYFLCVYMK